MDTQVIELVGRNRLVNELLEGGIEVALPLRDRGIDLLVYLDRGDDLEQFIAVPIQLKVSSGSRFTVQQKYSSFPNLLMVYLWGIGTNEVAETIALTQPEAVSIADAIGWTKTASWENGMYTATISAKLRALLEPYRITPPEWRAKLQQVMGHR